GEVVELDSRSMTGGGSVLSVVLCDDGKSCLEAVWFNQPHMAQRFRYGQRVSFSGKPKWYRDRWQMSNPRLQALDAGADGSRGVVPVYPLTEDLRPQVLRRLIGRALDEFSGGLVEVLPEGLRGQHGWPEVRQALRSVHFPASPAEAQKARQRFLY